MARPHLGTLTAYRAELRVFLGAYQREVPPEVQNILKERGIIDPDVLAEMTSGDPQEQISQAAERNIAVRSSAS